MSDRDPWAARWRMSMAELAEMKERAEAQARDAYHAATRRMAEAGHDVGEQGGEAVDKFKEGFHREMDRLMGRGSPPQPPRPAPQPQPLPQLRGRIPPPTDPNCVDWPLPEHTTTNRAIPAKRQGGGAFGDRRQRRDGSIYPHRGIDITAPEGTPLRAAGAGRVTVARGSPTYGKWIEIDHGDGLTTRYAHLDGIGVGVGDQVHSGEVIGRTGATGNADQIVHEKHGDPHLHWEVSQDGQVVNPYDRLCPPWTTLPRPRR